jgi:hypothetical protein
VYGALHPCHDRFAPSSFFTRGSSCFEMTAGWAKRRLRLGDFFSRMWVEKARRPRTLPVAVSLNRFFAPECVFIFGMTAAK